MKGFLHIVYFWLKHPDSEEDRAALIAGLETLKAVPTIKDLHIGVPAATEARDVLDNSFDVSEVMVFEDMDGHNVYQTHPLHKQFVDECGHLWAKVLVRDSIDV